jgi:hypothetical protein
MAVIYENNVFMKQSTRTYTMGGTAALHFVKKICQNILKTLQFHGMNIR